AQGGDGDQGHAQPAAQRRARRGGDRCDHARRQTDRAQHVSLRAVAAVAGACLSLGAVPGFGQDATEPAARAEAFAKLPYWPGYWVSEGQAGTTIGGIAPATLAAREAGTSPSVPMMALGGFAAPWNEEGRRRQAEARARSGGRKAMGW